MKIIVDCYGGDNAPCEIVKGAVAAVNENKNIKAVLCGKQDEINQILSGLTYDKEAIEVLNAGDVITCDESPTEAVRKQTDSSLVVGLKALKEDDEAKAFVSAGSTGAVLTGAILKVGRIKGVSRPALAPLIPNLLGGETMLLDCGANVDCKPVNLVHFALMGSVYMKEVGGVENPKVALLSNGTEDKKGCALTREVFGILSKLDGINFVGNMEARDIFSGDFDVIVTDGFYGNIALKSIEGTAACIFNVLKKEIKASKKAMLGAFLMKGALRGVKQTLDYNKKGGAVFLGVDKVIVKAHGSSKAEALKNAIFQAYNSAHHDINGKIKESIEAHDLTNFIKE